MPFVCAQSYRRVALHSQDWVGGCVRVSISPHYHCPNISGEYFKISASFIFQTGPQVPRTICVYTLQPSCIFLFFAYGQAVSYRTGIVIVLLLFH